MAGRQAKLLADEQVSLALKAIRRHRTQARDTVIFLLSVNAGLRAAEIANLTWEMVTTSSGEVGDAIALQDFAAKKRSGRTIPLNAGLRDALKRLAEETGTEGRVIKSIRGDGLNPNSVVNWFVAFYAKLGFKGASSHSGRRTFITKAARVIEQAGGSLRDVQQLAGHKSLQVTQGYIEGSAPAKQKIVSMI